jgi:peptide-methionine (S)-S-oxide reductase
LDAGWGARRDDLVVQVPLCRLPAHLLPLKQGQTIRLPGGGAAQGGVLVSVSHVNEEDSTVVLDANPPLAGASYACSFTVVRIDPLPQEAVSVFGNSDCHTDDDGHGNGNCDNHNDSQSASPYRVATFALDCFWGAELCLQRLPGVVGTKVGYTQGTTAYPTYDQVCTGHTRHVEAVLVVYDPSILPYATLVDAALDRLAKIMTASSSSRYSHDMFDEVASTPDESVAAATSSSQQYKYGIYYHSPEQQRTAMAKRQDAYGRGRSSHQFRNVRNTMDVLPAAIFYPAEEMHQQYLYKGGQSTRKGAKEPIRCFG